MANDDEWAWGADDSVTIHPTPIATMHAHVDEGEINLQVEACEKLKDEPTASGAHDVRVVIRNRLKRLLLAILLCSVAWLAYDVSQVSARGEGRWGGGAPARRRATV